MKTTFDFVDAMYRRLKASPLHAAVAGHGYKYRKPKGHEQEAYVINALPVDNRQVQSGMVNVNLFVPNKSIRIGLVADEGQPDTKRLSELADIAATAMEQWFEDGTHYEIEAQTLFADDESNSYYINFRVRVHSLNIA